FGADTALHHQALHQSLGTLPGTDLHVTLAGPYVPRYSDDIPRNAQGIRVSGYHPSLKKFERFLGTDEKGNKFIRNEHINVNPKLRGNGAARQIFQAQVENAARHGFSYLETHAAGDLHHQHGYIGYRVWPNMGFDQALNDYSHSPDVDAADLA